MPPGEDPFEKKVPEAPEPHFLLEEVGPPKEKWRITRERAVFISIIAHLVLVVLILTVKLPERPPRSEEQIPDPLGLLAIMKNSQPDQPIPIQFFPAPGPKSIAPGPRPLPSDQNREAHGGDLNFPKAPEPKAVAQAGIRDLDAGKRGEQGGAAAPPAAPPSQSPQQAGSQEGAERSLRSLALPNPTNDPPVRLKGLPSPSQVLANLTAEQAAQAARAARGGGGDEGGGFEHEGGFVDSGPLSFDTVGYDWGAYAAEMIRKIKRNWDIPSLARYGIKGRLSIRFYILKDGTVEAERIVSTSGKPPFDNSSFQAIARSSPFRPLPADLGHDREGVTITFLYNIRPEDYDRPDEGSGRPADPSGRN